MNTPLSEEEPRFSTGKRLDYIDWNEYFMGVCYLSAQRSKDPRTQVGACIVNATDHRIMAMGYNGAPEGFSDDEFPWLSKHDIHTEAPSSPSDNGRPTTKHLYVCHAELNAIVNRKHADLHGTRMYVTKFPCNDCAKLIIQSGIREVVYAEDPHPEKECYRASRVMFEKVGVRLVHYKRVKGVKINYN